MVGAPLRFFSNCPALLGRLVITTFLKVISAQLIKHTHTRFNTAEHSFNLVTSSHAPLNSSAFSKARPLGVCCER